MYAAAALVFVVQLAGGAHVRAQASVARGATEWSVTAGVARGIAILQSGGGQRYATTHVAFGRVLTDLRGPGRLRGRFEWSIEVTPIFTEWAGGRARGVGVAPLAWRWNFAPRGQVHPFAELGGGALWTRGAIPRDTTGSNFTSYAGLGLRVVGSGGHGLLVGYRLHHISNGNRLRANPGVNAHMITIGWTVVGAP